MKSAAEARRLFWIVALAVLICDIIAKQIV
jgi:hypothetical protein